MLKIMFVCHGNICRSPMAEFVMKDMLIKSGIKDVQISSSATSYEEIGNDIHYGTKKILDKYNIKYTKRQAVRLKKTDYEHNNLIIAMDKTNIRNIMNIIGSDPLGKVRLLLVNRDISDPWYTGDFDKTYKDVTEGCKKLLKEIIFSQKIDKF